MNTCAAPLIMKSGSLVPVGNPELFVCGEKNGIKTVITHP